MIAAPRTYSEWVSVLTMLKNKTDDEEVLSAMQRGSLEWQAGVADRFTVKLVDAVNARMNTATDKFQTDISRSNGQEGAIVQAILQLRKEMAFLVKVMDLPVIPEKSRAEYRNLVLDQADKMQKSLEDSARNDRTGRLASIIRNHKVNSF